MWLQIYSSHHPKPLHQASGEFYQVWLTSSLSARKEKKVNPVCSCSSASVIKRCLWFLYRSHSSELRSELSSPPLSYTVAQFEHTFQRRYWPSNQALRFQSLGQCCPTARETWDQTLSLHFLFWSKAPEAMTVSHYNWRQYQDQNLQFLNGKVIRYSFSYWRYTSNSKVLHN